MLIAVPDMPDNPDDLVTNPAALAGDALLEYTLTFLPASRQVDVGENGPWAWALTNDQGVPVAAPTGSVSVVYTNPQGAPSAATGPYPVLVDAQAAEAVHRVGFRYLLSAAGAYKLTLAVTMADGSIVEDRQTLLAS